MDLDQCSGSERGDDPRYDQVVQAAVEIITTIGHQTLDIAVVSWRAGIAPEEVSRLFTSRLHLFVSVLEWRDVNDIETVRAAYERGEIEGPRGILHELVRHNSTQPKLLALYTQLVAMPPGDNKLVADYFERRYRESHEILEDIVGSIADDPSRAADQILAALDGLQVRWLRDTSAFDLVEAWDAMAARLLP